MALSADHVAQLERHARRAYPGECCGALIGLPRERPAVCSVHPTENHSTARVRDRYEVDPKDILRLDRLAERRGQEILGFYHSHPDHPPVPSAADAALAWAGYVYLIVAVAEDGRTEVRAWSFDERRHRFRECPIERLPDEMRAPEGTVLLGGDS